MVKKGMAISPLAPKYRKKERTRAHGRVRTRRWEAMWGRDEGDSGTSMILRNNKAENPTTESTTLKS